MRTPYRTPYQVHMAVPQLMQHGIGYHNYSKGTQMPPEQGVRTRCGNLMLRLFA